MMEEFDEDVVFENSPLFRYLHNLGHTDFEACPTAAREEDERPGTPWPGSPEAEGLVVRMLAQSLGGLSPFLKAARSSDTLERQLDGVLGEYSVRCILERDVLLQEDVELIQLLDPGLMTLGPTPDGGGAPPPPRFFAAPSSRDSAFLAASAAILTGLFSASGGAWWPWSLLWLLITLGWSATRAAALWKRGGAQRAVHGRLSQLRALLGDSKALTGLSRKALRLVQETEVISRGFTLVSAAGHFSRAGPGSRQLRGLRQALYRALRSAFRASRRATCHMLKEFPLGSEVDNVTNYLSAVPLKELGLGLGIEQLADERARELTDDYSLPALKVLFQLWVGQSSECYRRLALLMSPRRLEEERQGGGRAHAPALHAAIGAVTQPLQRALAACLEEVRRSYDFHRRSGARVGSRDPGARGPEKSRELDALHSSVRSLQLHLKALLSEMIILEDDLEKLTVSKGARELTPDGYRELSARLNQLQPHMRASAGCWDDTVGQVERMLRRADPCPGAAESRDRCGTPPVQAPEPPPPCPLILDRDPVPEELEFEAYVSESDSDGQGEEAWCDRQTPEERECRRREREESRRVLYELKSVLGFRASEGERMKRKQMLFSDRAASARCSDAAVDGSAEPVEKGNGGRNDLSEGGNGREAREGKELRLRPDPSEFSCGLEAEGDGEEATSVCARGGGGGGGGGASESHQYDGDEDDEDEARDDDAVRPLRAKVPTVSIMDRLTEIHGSRAFSFSSAVAAQVAARSHSLPKMEEQTFGDDEYEEED
ncbi:vezatin isoform X2 [Stigmatopora nigra]